MDADKKLVANEITSILGKLPREDSMIMLTFMDGLSKSLQERRARVRKLEIEAEIAEKRFDNLGLMANAASNHLIETGCPDLPDDESYCANESCTLCEIMRTENELVFPGYECRLAVQEIEDVIEAAVFDAKCAFSGHVRVAVRGGEPLSPCDRKWRKRDGCVWVSDDAGERKLDRLPVGRSS